MFDEHLSIQWNLTLWDQIFLVTFYCNIEVFLFQRLKLIGDTCWDVVIMEVFLYSVLNSEGLLREVPL